MIRLVALPLTVTSEDIKVFKQRQANNNSHYESRPCILPLLYSVSVLMANTGMRLCAEEHQGFGGECLSEEQLKEMWLAYYEVRTDR